MGLTFVAEVRGGQTPIKAEINPEMFRKSLEEIARYILDKHIDEKKKDKNCDTSQLEDQKAEHLNIKTDYENSCNDIDRKHAIFVLYCYKR